MIAVQILAALACGPLDRLRGHATHLFGLRLADKVAYGLALSLIMSQDPVVVVFTTLAMIAGMSPGWGEPMGAILDKREMKDFEWWQFGPLKQNPWLALMFRGFLWGLPVVPVAVYFQDISLLAYILAFTVAMPLAMLAARLPFGRDKWGSVEFARGWVAGAILFGLSFVL